ncbi:nitroreductase [Candidatus Peregrinibacteria bacterium]|nr:nitroreductase [Candidatus Peregrinibacteria bacterium]
MNQYPDKVTPLSYPINDLLAKRWSPMAFSDKAIEKEKISSLFEAAKWAPSSFNGQPWKIIYAEKENKEEYDRLASLLVEGNDWAKDAYLLLLICASKNFEYKNKPNKHHQYDTGAAIENLFLQAVSMDLVGHEMAGFDSEKAYKLLNIPEEVSVLAMMAIGYPGTPSDLSRDLQERQNAERERKPIEKFAFKGKWKQ